MKRPGYSISTAILIVILLGLLVGAWRLHSVDLTHAVMVNTPPRISPDYADTVIPPNIAPLNFTIREAGRRYCVDIRSVRGDPLRVVSRSGAITIPPRAWSKLLQANLGQRLTIDICVEAEAGGWRRFAPVVNTIAREPIDSHLVYRKIKPLYNFWGPVGIYQRDLESYKETQLYLNMNVDDSLQGCANCHAFNKNQPDSMVLHVRGPNGGMLLLHGGELTKIDTRTQFNKAPGAFTSWHPSGKAIAFSMNTVRQFFHPARAEVRDAFDLDSDMALYLIDSKLLTSTAAIRRPDRLETFPGWSADGKSLYFCSAPKLWDDDQAPPDRYREVQYDLVRIACDIETGQWGEVETVLSAKDFGKSITQPKVSPDGRFIVVCMSEYSMQPSFQTDADLYLLDLESGRCEPMACNSELSESWHSWSSNGRWLAFSSKRDDGQFIRAYFSYIDAHGTAAKPFVLPQKDARFYESCIFIYQLPELVKAAVPITEQQVIDLIRKTDSMESHAITGASTMAPSS